MIGRLQSGLAITLLTASRLAADGDGGLEDPSLLYAYFVCSIYAEMAGQDANASFYLERGQAAGHRFFREHGTSEPPDREKNDIPVAVLWNMQGQSIDFTLKKISATAKNHVTEDFGTYPTDDAGEMLAYLELVDRNCDLLRGHE